MCWGFIVVDKFPSSLSNTEGRGDGGKCGGGAVTVSQKRACAGVGGKTTDRGALYNRRFQTEEKLYVQEQECAGSNERGKVLWLHACVRCQGTGYKRYPTLSCAAKNISWCVYKKECADWSTLRWKREPTGQEIGQKVQTEYIYICMCLSVCLCVQLVQVNNSTQRGECWLSIMASGLYRRC